MAANRPHKYFTIMKILIDGRPITSLSAGITSFFKGSVITWAEQNPDDIFYVAIPRETDRTFHTSGLPQNMKLILKTNRLLRRLPNLVWLNVMMPVLSRRLKADIYFSPLPCIPYGLPKKMKKIITVHDVVNIEYQGTMQLTNVLSNIFLFKRSVNTADGIWTNSSYTKGKVEHYFPDRRCKDIFAGCSIDTKTYRRIGMSEDEIRSIKEKYGIRGVFILFVGSLEPRKNLGFLISIMPEIYGKTGAQLVIVGARGWKSSSVNKIMEGNRILDECVIFCNYVPDKDLLKLYNTASCFVSASLNEGFGMPQLEALFCGCPIVTAHNSAMMEVAKDKDGAKTVEGYKPEDWIAAVTNIMNNRPEVNKEQLKKYDWNQISKDFIRYINTLT